MALTQGAARIRIRTVADAATRPMGRDVLVSVVLPDGSEHPLTNVTSVTFRVNARNGYATVGLVIQGAEVDVEGVLDDAESRAAAVAKSAEDAARLLSETGGF